MKAYGWSWETHEHLSASIFFEPGLFGLGLIIEQLLHGGIMAVTTVGPVSVCVRWDK